jgi:hypothetical protein
LSLPYIFGKRHPSGWHLLRDTGIQFAHDVHMLLTSDFRQAYHQSLEQKQYEIVQTLNSLGVPTASEFAHLYLNYGPFCVRGHYELNEVESLVDGTDYAHSELGVDPKFIALTSIEGGGITLYDRTDGKIYDVEFGEFDLLRDGKFQPTAETMADFVRWCARSDLDDFGEIEEL